MCQSGTCTYINENVADEVCTRGSVMCSDWMFIYTLDSIIVLGFMYYVWDGSSSVVRVA